MKIMKKSFSFVCCLFLAVSCFAPFAAASDPSKKAVVAKGNTSVANVSGVQASAGRVVEHTKVIEHTKVVEFADVSAMKASAASASSAVAAASTGRASGFATPAGDREHIYLTLKAHPNLRLSLPGFQCVPAPINGDWSLGWTPVNGPQAYGNDKPDYVTWLAHLFPDGTYIIELACCADDPKHRGDTLVLDEDAVNGTVRGSFSTGSLTQRWGFEPAESSGYFRLKNIGTGRYLTWDPKGVVGWAKRGPESCVYEGQIWQKH